MKKKRNVIFYREWLPLPKEQFRISLPFLRLLILLNKCWNQTFSKNAQSNKKALKHNSSKAVVERTRLEFTR